MMRMSGLNRIVCADYMTARATANRLATFPVMICDSLVSGFCLII
jgi:hypothetical protein